MKEVKDEYLEYVEKKYDRDDEVNQEASIDLEKVGQLKSNPVSNDEKLKEIMDFSKDFGLDATTKVLEVLNQYKDEEKDEEVDSLQAELAKRKSNYNAIYNTKVKEWNKRLSAKDDALKRLKILMRSSIGAIEEANERRLRCLKGWAKAENSLKTQISVALQDLEEFTEDSRLDYEQTTF